MMEVSRDRSGTTHLRLPNGETVEVRGTLRIGRASDNELVLTDPAVSRHHCSLTLAGDALLLQDSGSTAGTLVNGRKVGRQPHPLRDGDQVSVGPVDLTIVRRQAAPAEELAGRTQVISSLVP